MDIESRNEGRRRRVVGRATALTLAAALFVLARPWLSVACTGATLVGRGGSDRITGGSCDDVLVGNDGDNILTGGGGRDRFVFSTGYAGDPVIESFPLDFGISTITDFVRGEDVIVLDRATFTFLQSAPGAGLSEPTDFAAVDTDDAVGNEDAVIVYSRESGTLFYADDAGATAFAVLAGSPLLTAFDLVIADFTPRCIGDTLVGRGGDDDITGSSCDDTLVGNDGDNVLTGGDGYDAFVFSTGWIGDPVIALFPPDFGVTEVTDFEPGIDRLVLDKGTFTALTSVVGDGFSVASELAVVDADAAAGDASALIVYSTESGTLFYNENGPDAGLGRGGPFAELDDVEVVAARDFTLIDLRDSIRTTTTTSTTRLPSTSTSTTTTTTTGVRSTTTTLPDVPGPVTVASARTGGGKSIVVTCTLADRSGAKRARCEASGRAVIPVPAMRAAGGGEGPDGSLTPVTKRVKRRFNKAGRARLVLPLNSKGRSVLRTAGSLPVLVTVQMTDGTGRISSTEHTILLSR